MNTVAITTAAIPKVAIITSSNSNKIKGATDYSK